MKFEKLAGGGILVTTTANTFSIENGCASAEGTLNDTVIIRRHRQVLYVLPYTDIQKADNSFATSTDDAVAYLSDVFATLGSGGGGGIAGAINGLNLDGTNAKLGGVLTGNTNVYGAFLLNLGDQANPLQALETTTLDATVLTASNPGVAASNLQLDSTFFNLRHFNEALAGKISIEYEFGNDNGILITDEIDEMGLNGAVDFSDNYVETSYVQKGWADIQIENAKEYTPVQYLGNGGILPGYTMDLYNITQIIDGTVTITLPDLTTAGRKLRYTFKHIGAANTITIVTSGGQTIDGSASVVLTTQYETITVISSNNNWYLI